MAVEKVVEAVVDQVRSAGLVQIEVSARHVHLDKESVAILFGEGHTLTPKRELSQPGQYLEEERVDVIGPKGTFKNVAVLGPERKHVQVEVSFSDAFALGINPPIRQSGDTKGSASVTLKGPKGEITIDEGAIVALRHVHMTPEDAEKLGLVDNQVVSVEVLSDRRTLFEDTVIRVSPKFRTRMHVDVDEAGAAHIAGFTLGRIIK
ncbi:MAG: phosphate propanoyltransferase [Oscillospiraceae bacterium]